MTTTPKVSVIIPHYFTERIASLYLAFSALAAGTVQPVEILVWDNTGRLDGGGSVVKILRSPKNLGPAARFLAVHLVDPASEYIFFQDNDVSVAPTTLADLLRWHAADGGVVTAEGRLRDPRSPYQRWPKRYGKDLPHAPECVDVALGRADLLRVTLMHALLDLVTTPGLPVMDDLAFSAACARSRVPIYVVPTAALGNHDAGVGMCRTPDYYARRDAAARALNWGDR